MVSSALLVLSVAVPQDVGHAPQLETASVWRPLTFLLGEWVGAGAPGQGSGAFSFEWDPRRKVLIRRNRADYPMTKDRPAFSHEDLMIIYPDSSTKRLRAIYFDNESHVINYAIHVIGDQKSIEFLSDRAPLSPAFRLTIIRAENPPSA
jgi:hypothetical protein